MASHARPNKRHNINLNRSLLCFHSVSPIANFQTPSQPNQTICPRSICFIDRSAYRSRLPPIIFTISKICVPLNVSAQSRTTAPASCRSFNASFPAISGETPIMAGSKGTANSVSSNNRRTVSKICFSSSEIGGSEGVMTARVSNHLASKMAHSKLHTAKQPLLANVFQSWYIK